MVIPAYNEERFIGSVVLQALQYAHTVIVVDDGSADKTAIVAQTAGAGGDRLPVCVAAAGIRAAGRALAYWST